MRLSLLRPFNGYTQTLTAVFVIVAITAFSGLIGVSVVIFQNSIWMVVCVLLGISVIPVLYNYPKLWIYTAAATMGIFIAESGGGITAAEVVLASLNVGGILCWIFWKIFVQREYSAVFKDTFDILYCGLLLVSVITMIPTIAHGGTFLTWGQEWYVLLMSLWYLPIRYYLKTQNDWLVFLACLTASSIWIAVDVLVFYQLIVKNSVYAYQISGLRHNHAVGITVIAFCTTIILQRNLKWYYRALLISNFGICFIAVLASFGRTGMLAAIISFVVVVAFASWNERWRVLGYVAVLSIVAVTIVTIKFGNIAPIIGKIISNRVLSTSKGMRDVTVIQRIQEANKVLSEIKRNPLLGYGFNIEYLYYDSLLRYSWRHTYIHGGYLAMFYKLGIPIAFCFYLLIVAHIVRVFYAMYQNRKSVNILRVSLAIIVFIMASHTTEAQFYWKQSAYVVGISFALYYYAQEKRNQANTELNTLF